MDSIIKKIKGYINEIDYGQVVVSIHQGKVAYIEKKEKEKINSWYYIQINAY